jgi:hypothetical protein
MSTWTAARSTGAAAIAALLLVACQDAGPAGPAPLDAVLESKAGGVACFAKKTLSERLEFANADRAGKILRRPNDWARQLSAFDRGARMRTLEPTTTESFLAFASNAGLGWTPAEQAHWTTLAERLSDAAFHVLTRENAALRHALYALLGFERFAKFEYPAELEGRRLSNPDAHYYDHALAVQTPDGPSRRSGSETAWRRDGPGRGTASATGSPRPEEHSTGGEECDCVDRVGPRLFSLWPCSPVAMGRPSQSPLSSRSSRATTSRGRRAGN